MHVIRLVAAAALLGFLALPAFAQTDEVPTQEEIKQTEGEPPVIPHKVTEKETARECLACHKKGKKGAPVTPHPERQACTQCHVPCGGFATNNSGKKK